MMFSFSSTSQVLVPLAIVVFSFTKTSLAISTLGSPSDYETQTILQQCLNNATISDNYDPAPGFGWGKCPQLINCILSGSTEGNKAGMSAGAGIAALIPTMLALIGEPSCLLFLGTLGGCYLRPSIQAPVLPSSFA